MFHVWNMFRAHKRTVSSGLQKMMLRYDDNDIICEIDAPIPANQRNNLVLFATDFESVNARMRKI